MKLEVVIALRDDNRMVLKVLVFKVIKQEILSVDVDRVIDYIDLVNYINFEPLDITVG